MRAQPAEDDNLTTENQKAGSTLDDPSQRYRFLQDPIPDSRLQSLFRSDVDATAEEVLQVHQQASKIQETPPFLEFDQEIDVAPLIGLPSRHGAEHAYMPGA